ncbi:MAG: hypothetical protein AKCLJLPJ_01563 [Fimbriimonadales bacterium]|nr:hypothetical protein [Fimbriimonadales bacterium]
METKPSRITACAFLRCKQDTYEPPLVEGEEPQSSVPRVYWCGKTLGPFGPDGELVDVASCQAERECFSGTIAGGGIPMDDPQV